MLCTLLVVSVIAAPARAYTPQEEFTIAYWCGFTLTDPIGGPPGGGAWINLQHIAMMQQKCRDVQKFINVANGYDDGSDWDSDNEYEIAGRGRPKACSALDIQARAPYKTGRNSRGEFQVWGRVYVKNLARTTGCRLNVCLAEELGRGNWQPGWCKASIVNPRGGRWYPSDYPWFWCSDYRGTGYVRSYARFEGSQLRVMGAPEKVC